MTRKFGRQFRLTIDPKDGGPTIVATLPFTLRFWVKRDISANLNNTSIDIFNLSRANRKRIYQDRWNLQENVINGVPVGRRSVKLEIGYDQLYTVYEGDILSASSSREGTNIVTRIEGMTGVFDVASSQVNATLAPGPLAALFSYMVSQFPSLSLGYIGSWPAILPRDTVLNGNTWDLIRQYSNGNCFIDNGKIYILQPDEALGMGSQIPVIDSSTGILETPRREQSYLSVTTLMEASIKINQIVQINSVVEPVYNGQYKVLGIQHTGTISGAVGGDCRSVFHLLAPGLFSYKQVAP